MTSDTLENETKSPIINFEVTAGLTDYFCPYCNQKLFRGKVNKFNMVCSNCNKLVSSETISEESPQEKE